MALKEDGSVVVWGLSQFDETNVPSAAQSEVIAISAGAYHCLALKSDGSVVAWGAGANDPVRGFNQRQSIVPLAAASGVIAIAAGSAHSMALKGDGSVVVWGSNGEGQRDVPSMLGRVVAIAAGAGFSVGLVATIPDLGLRGPTLVGGEFRFFGQGFLPGAYRVEISSDLTNWGHFTSLVDPTNGVPIQDPVSASTKARFYRLIKMP